MKKNITINSITKYNNTINIVLNIALCLTVCFLTNFNIILIALSYIFYDFISIFINKIIWKYQIKKIVKYDADELKNAVAFESNFDEYFTDYVLNCIKSLEQKSIETKNDLIEIDNNSKLQQTNQKRKMIFDSSIDLLKNYINENNIEKTKKINKLLKLLNELKEAIEKNPSGLTFVDGTFNVYTKEFINIIDLCKDSNDEEVMKKYDNIINTFINYIKRTIEKIQNYNKNNIDISYSVLMEELEKANK